MFHGSMVALVTPFNDDNSIDFEALERLIEMHIAQGTYALVVAGTTGEAATLSLDEKRQLLQRTVAIVKGRIPVIAGSAAQGTEQTIGLSLMALEQGVDALLIMTPAYIKPTQEGLYLHYQAISQACPLPIILYNVPSRTACQLSVDTIVRLSEISNIVGIKEASGQPSITEEIMARCGHRIDVFSGDDDKTLPLMKLGAKGVISVTANIAPKKVAELCRFALEGDFEMAGKIDKQLEALNHALFLESNPIPCKWLMSQQGLIKSPLRLPLTPLSAGHHTALQEAFENL